VQNQGIGKRLLAAAERELQERGFSWAEIAVDQREPRAEALYLRLGYKQFGIRGLPPAFALEEQLKTLLRERPVTLTSETRRTRFASGCATRERRTAGSSCR
jgi:ribosomal protein S18 acetylase RimI-like enzyme